MPVAVPRAQPLLTPEPMPEAMRVARRARPTPQAGQLTAGVWDDNRNPEFFRPYLANAVRQGRDTSLFNQLTPETGRDAVLATSGAHQALDIQLVLDTTGSMGDELSYLQSEFDSIAAQVHTRFPQIVPRWSLVV